MAADRANKTWYVGDAWMRRSAVTLNEPDLRVLVLWQAVLVRAIEDSLSAFKASERRDARAWLSEPSQARALILSYVGIDHDAYITRGLPRLQRKWREIDAAIAAKRAARKAAKAAAAPAGRLIGQEAGAGALQAA